MGTYFEKLDLFAEALAKAMIRYRWFVVLAVLVLVGVAASGGKHLGFSNNYRAFFSEENPELTAFEDLQATYTKNDNFVFVLEPKSGNAFSNDTLAAVAKLTEEAWQIPHAHRVDSLSNYQYSYSEEDDLIVEDFVQDPGAYSDQVLQEKKAIALAEPLLLHQLVDTSSHRMLEYVGRQL